jgi:hypothetical protein
VSPLQFMIDHIDSCPRCGLANYCETGRVLMDRAARIAAELILPSIPPIPKSGIKA